MRGRKIKTQADVDRLIKKGLGQGEREEYQPWFRVKDVPSHGRSSRINGLTVDREYHLLSDIERGYFLQLDFAEKVIDIREQFPIFPVAAVETIANSLGISYPCYPGSNVPYVMTTDFLVTVQNNDGSTTNFARTVKPYNIVGTHHDGLLNTLQKFDIEKIYWESQGVDWKIITEINVPLVITRNLSWLSKKIDLDRSLREHKVLSRFLSELQQFQHSQLSLEKVLRHTGSRLHITYADCISLFRYVTWYKFIRIDLMQPIQITLPIPDFEIIYPTAAEPVDREVV